MDLMFGIVFRNSGDEMIIKKIKRKEVRITKMVGADLPETKKKKCGSSWQCWKM
jgi:hypothetical protein